MALSDSTDFTLNRNEIIDSALELVGAKEEDLTPSASEVAKASKWLNLMLKSWHKQGTMLHVRTTGTIFLEKDKQSYNLGTGTYAARGTVTDTTTDTAVVASDVIIPVTATTGMTVGDNIGILQDDDTIHWDTISTINAGVDVHITNGVASAAASGNAVYSYTNVAHRPVMLQKVILRDTSGQDIPLEALSQDEYMELNDKDMSARTSRYFYDPQLGNAILNPWPVIDQNGYKLIYKYTKPFDDVDTATDNVEFESDWELAIIYGLAEHLMVSYAVEEPTEKRIVRGANRYFKSANKFEVEESSMYLQPSED